MPESVLELADRLWRAEIDVASLHPVSGFVGGMCEPAEDVAFLSSFANVSAFRTDDGLVMVDTGSSFVATQVHEKIRTWSTDRLNTAIYSHGHIDHVFGVGAFEEESAGRGWQTPVVVAHEALPARFDRYIATAGYNAAINQRQFDVPGLRWPTEYRYPDRTYRDLLEMEVGGLRVELHHARGETDDHTWSWFPDLKVLCCGDLFIWATPNAGNPQKVQRYPLEWAKALRQMVILGPQILLPGHGLPVVGEERVRQALTETAELLEHLVDATLEMMNRGARLDEILHSVRAPRHLLERPYLRPVYDEPEFVVRNIWRQFGGWWDGNPANLKPAPDELLAHELCALAGGAAAVAERAGALLHASLRATSEDPKDDDVPASLRLAAHLAELASLAARGDPAIERVRAQVFSACAERATSTMAKGVFSWAVRESRARAEPGN